MSKPASYREVQNNCANCKNSEMTYDYDEFNYYYCTKNAPPRPFCGSVAMDEPHFPNLSETMKQFNMTTEDIEHGNPKFEAHELWYYAEYEKAKKLWDDWAENRAVNELGTCDEWESR